MAEIRPPAPRPCESCPYRQDVPAGVWAPEEYDRLPGYDGQTFEQPAGVFLCHQQNGRVCGGWAGCHDGDNLLGLRMAGALGVMSAEDIEATRDYVSPVPLWSSGTEAARHGLSEVDAPGERAEELIVKLGRAKARREGLEAWELEAVTGEQIDNLDREIDSMNRDLENIRRYLLKPEG